MTVGGMREGYSSARSEAGGNGLADAPLDVEIGEDRPDRQADGVDGVGAGAADREVQLAGPERGRARPVAGDDRAAVSGGGGASLVPFDPQPFGPTAPGPVAGVALVAVVGGAGAHRVLRVARGAAGAVDPDQLLQALAAGLLAVHAHHRLEVVVAIFGRIP